MKRLLLLFALILSTVIAIAQAKNTVYTGTIKGYTPTWGFKTGQVIVNNVVTGLTDTYLIDIAPDGTFIVNFPLNSNKECWVSFPFFNSAVYFEAGKKLVHDFDVSDAAKVSSVFKGDGAAINNDINKARPIISTYNWDSINSDIYQFTPEQYKTYFLRMQAQKLAAIDSIQKSAGLNKIAYRLLTDNVKYWIAGVITSYNSEIDAAYRKKNHIPFEDRTPVLTPVKLDQGYYSFLRELRYNDPLAMEVNSYYVFINRIKFLDLIYDKAGRLDYTKEINDLKKRDTSDINVKKLLNYLNKGMNHNATVPGTLEKARPVVLKSLLKTDITLELELMDLQDTCQNINRNKTPLSDSDLASLKSRLKNRYLLTDVLQLNNKVKQAIEASKTQTGYTNNETPGAVADSVFDKIINRYQGKVVFIDFWATWCEPCLMGIQEMGPMKSELKDKDIVFLYITNNTSPEKAYRIMSPSIKGEHYRLTADEYSVLAKRFQINGIPHYAIANKKGVVVENGSHSIDTEKLKVKLMQMAKE